MEAASSAATAEAPVAAASVDCAFHDFSIEMVPLGNRAEPISGVILSNAYACPDPACQTMFSWSLGWIRNGRPKSTRQCPECRKRYHGAVWMLPERDKHRCLRCGHESRNCGCVGGGCN